jgi:lipopolysaccharide export system protein LptC
MTANGMNYNNVTRVMKLYGQVRGAIAASDTH